MRPSNFLCLLLAVTSVALCHADEASSAPRKQDTPLGETVALVVFDVAKSVALFEGVSLAWMLSSWVLASLLQPAHGQLGEGFFLPMVQSIIGKPVRSKSLSLPIWNAFPGQTLKCCFSAPGRACFLPLSIFFTTAR